MIIAYTIHKIHENVLTLQYVWFTFDKIRCLCRQWHRSSLNHRLKHRSPHFRLDPLVLMFCAVLCCPVCLFVYGSFCQGALQLDVSTFFYNILSLNISSIHIVNNGSCIWDKDFRINFRCWKPLYLSYTPM